MIKAATSCNLRCKHCYNCNDNTFIEVSMVEKLMSMVDTDTNMYVTLTGGEVLLHPRLDDILSVLRNHNKIVSFNTNGTLLTEQKLDKIVSSGCVIDTFQLSLYAVIPEMHDEITGVKGSFKKTVAAIKLLKAKGMKVRIASLITPQNADQVKPLIDFARTEDIKISFCFKCISNCHDACSNADCDLSIEQFVTSYTDYLDSIRKFYLNKHPVYADHICMAGLSKCTIGADGSMFLCPTWKELPFVNIQSISSFSEFWDYDIIRKIRGIKRSDFSACEKCEIREYCRPCLADNFNKNRDVMQVNPDHCKLEKVKHSLELLRLDRNNPSGITI